MINRNIILKIFLSLVFFCSLGFLTIEGSYYWEFRQVAKAVGGMPWQDGGMVTYYDAMCSKTYDPITGLCKTCPMCTASVGRDVCVGYQEIQLAAQNGTMNICVPIGFLYSGGGVMPTVGGGIIAGGASNIMPWVIGVP